MLQTVRQVVTNGFHAVTLGLILESINKFYVTVTKGITTAL